MQVIEPIQQGEISRWYAKMLIVMKPNGEPSQVVDFQKLNKATSRESNHTPNPINTQWKIGCVEWLSQYSTRSGCLCV